MRPRGIPDHVVPIDDPLTFVTCEASGNVHVFVSATFNLEFVRLIANNLSHRVRQPVKVFYDEFREKYRLCPISARAIVNTTTYGILCFTCENFDSGSAEVEHPPNTQAGNSLPIRTESGRRIPRPRNQWILYRQAKYQEVVDTNPGITASQVSTIIARMWREEPPEVKAHWQAMAAEEDRRHKEMYPDYKYTKRSAKKNNPLEGGPAPGEDGEE